MKYRCFLVCFMCQVAVLVGKIELHFHAEDNFG